MPTLNDVHSRLNPTDVAQVHTPSTTTEVQNLLLSSARANTALATAGGRHAMGGQQFLTGGDVIDMRGMDRVLGTDSERGLLRIEAGAMWPSIIEAARTLRTPDGGRWGIRQKQTGVDAVTLGGSISVSAHGRGLDMQPLGDDIEDLEIVLPDGESVKCSRSENAELFSLAVGGYGLFGVITSATLRLRPVQRVRRLVDVLDLEDALSAIRRRIADGCVYGDFQFVIDPHDPQFLTRGVMACYLPVSPDDAAEPAARSELSQESWISLLGLAHVDKAEAFRRYAQHYIGTHGQVYDSDRMQLATYVADYAELIRQALPDIASEPESLMIGELYVPHDRLLAFMTHAREVLRSAGVEVIYGTIRAIRRDTTSYLPWAQHDFACVIFNLRTRHTPAGRARTAEAFRGLIDAALAEGGTYFLTYHRYARPDQLLRAHPRLPSFAEHKSAIDPHGRITSDWWRHIRAQLEGEPTDVRGHGS